MKLIYIIIAHGEPSLALRMIDKLDGPENRFLIHVDKKTKQDIFLRYKQALENRPNVVFIPRIPVYWGDFSIMQVEFNAMALIRRNGYEYDFAILLSGAHYPIKTKEKISEYFQNKKGSIFLEYRALPTDSSHTWSIEDGGMRRILYWHITRHLWLETFIYRFIFPVLKKLMLESLLKRKYKLGLKPYGHSQWWCLDKAAIDYILDFADKNKEIISFFKHSHVPDEMMIQIILLNSPHKDRVINDNLVHIKWPAQAGSKSPCILSCNDISTLVRSDKLFARKFDQKADPGLFDEIDRKIQIP